MPAAAAFGALSLVGWWWGLPTAIAAFVAGRGPGRGRTLVLVLAGALVAGAAAVAVVPSLLTLGTQFVAVIVLAVLVPWFVGRFSRQYRELVRAGWERAEQLERERQLIAEQARLLERARIARDMHDVLGHDLSLIALSAGALKLAPGLDERHRQAAQDIRGRAGAAVERLGEVIGVLREESEDPPQGPGGSDIPRLVGDAAASGLAVELTVTGEAAGLPPAVERAAHRVVQEGLTNAAKHAPGESVSVELSHTATETRVVVRNGAPAASAGPGGRGLAGPGGRGSVGPGGVDSSGWTSASGSSAAPSTTAPGAVASPSPPGCPTRPQRSPRPGPSAAGRAPHPRSTGRPGGVSAAPCSPRWRCRRPRVRCCSPGSGCGRRWPRPGPSSTRATTPACGWGRIGPTYGRCCRTGSRWSGRRAPDRRNEV